MAERHRFLNSMGIAQPQNLPTVRVLCVLVFNLTLNISGKSPCIYMHQPNYHMWNFRLSFNRLHKPTDRIRFIFVTGECSKALKMKRNLLDKYSVSLDDSWQHLPLVNDDQTLGQFHQVEHNSNKSFCRSELRGEIHTTRMSYIKTSIPIYSRILTNIHSSTISDKTGEKEHLKFIDRNEWSVTGKKVYIS
jgi:hypothetical protein